MGRAVRRGLAAVLAAVVLAVVGAAVAWRLAGPAIVEGRITRALEEQGIAVAALTVDSVGLERTVLSDVELDLAGGLALDRIEAHYRLGELIGDRRIERLDLSGIRVDLMTAAGAPRQPTTGGDATLPVLPVGRIVMQDSAISLASPVGTVALAVDLEALPDAEGGLTLSGEAMLRADAGEARIPFTAAVMPSGAFEASLATRAGRVSWRGATLDVGDGSVDLAGTRAGLDRIDATLAGEFGMPGGKTAALTLTGQLSDDTGAISAMAESIGGDQRVTLSADASRRSASSSPVDLSIRADLPLLTELLALVGLEAPSLDGALQAGLVGEFTPGDAGEPSFEGRLHIDAALQPEAPDEPTTIAIESDLALARIGTGWSMQVAGPYAVAGRDGRVSGAVELSASADRAGDGLAGRVAGDVSASGSLAELLEISGATAELSAGFRQHDGRWRVMPDGCMPIAIEGMAIGGRLAAPEGATACLSALPDRPLIAFGAGDPSLAFEVRADPMTAVLDEGTPDGFRLQVSLPSMTVSADRLGRPGQSAKIAISGAAVQVPMPGIGFEGVDLTLSADGVSEPSIDARLDAATVLSLQAPAWFAPLTLSGDAEMDDAGFLAFRGTVLGPASVAAKVEGRHDPQSGAGRMALRLDPVSFAPGIRQPVDLSPVLAATPIGEVTGSVAGRARMAWGTGIVSSGELDLEDVTLAVSGVTIRSIDGRLNADSLFPLNLPDGQLLALGGADLGVSLEDGALAFGLSDGDRLSVQGMGFGLAGGSLAVAPFQARLGDRELPLVLTLQGVDLARLSEQFAVEDLTVTGHMDGRVPLRLIDDTISIENGVLESTEGGVIRYVAALPFGQPGEGGVALLLSAVRNFQYEAIRATLNGRTGEDLDVAIRLTGANPEVYDGFPIALNVNLSGALDQILLSGLRSLAIADQTGRILRGE